MATGSTGFFSAPYEENDLLRMASSSDSLERWEAANALAELDLVAGAKVYRLLENDSDSLVQKALANQRERFGSGTTRYSSPKKSELKENFQRAWVQPLGPLKKARLAEMAMFVARDSFQRRQSIRRSTSFPQANSVETLMHMLDQLVDTNSIMGKKLGLVDRQVLYYRDALRFLDMIELSPRGMISIEPKIAQLRTPYQRLDFTIRSLLGVQSTSAAFLGLLGESAVSGFLVPKNAKEFMEFFGTSADSEGLSGSTLNRRAQTALAWATQVLITLGIEVAEPAGWRTALSKYPSHNRAHTESL